MQDDFSPGAFARRCLAAAAVTTANVAAVVGAMDCSVGSGDNLEGSCPARKGNRGQQHPHELHAAQEDAGAHGPPR